MNDLLVPASDTDDDFDEEDGDEAMEVNLIENCSSVCFLFRILVLNFCFILRHPS